MKLNIVNNGIYDYPNELMEVKRHWQKVLEVTVRIS